MLTAEVRLSERLAAERGYSHRTDRIAVDLSAGWFRHRSETGDDRTEIEQINGTFTTRLNGSTEISAADREKHRLGSDGLRLPKRRRWHMNRDGEQIATDDVISIESVARR